MVVRFRFLEAFCFSLLCRWLETVSVGADLAALYGSNRMIGGGLHQPNSKKNSRTTMHMKLSLFLISTLLLLSLISCKRGKYCPINESLTQTMNLLMERVVKLEKKTGINKHVGVSLTCAGTLAGSVINWAPTLGTSINPKYYAVSGTKITVIKPGNYLVSVKVLNNSGQGIFPALAGTHFFFWHDFFLIFDIN